MKAIGSTTQSRQELHSLIEWIDETVGYLGEQKKAVVQTIELLDQAARGTLLTSQSKPEPPAESGGQIQMPGMQSPPSKEELIERISPVHRELARRLVRFADERDGRVNYRQAVEYLAVDLEVTDPKSKKFTMGVWAVLAKSGLFMRVARGVYQINV